MLLLKPEGERQFQAEVIKLARILGWRVYFTQRSDGSPAGFPDLVLVKPPRVLFWELKSDSGRLSAAQRETQELLGACTEMKVGVLRPMSWSAVVAELQRAA